MTDHLESNPLAYQARQRRHRHNSFHGGVAMAKANMFAIIQADSTSNEAKDFAKSIVIILDQLKESLRTRIDPNPKAKQ